MPLSPVRTRMTSATGDTGRGHTREQAGVTERGGEGWGEEGGTKWKGDMEEGTEEDSR